MRTRAPLRMGVAVALAVTLGGSAARADAGEANDVRALEQRLSEEHAALETSDCMAACRALASIRRAADKICALEPGPRCEAARGKASDATDRVRSACPDCAVASSPPGVRPNHDERAAVTEVGSVAPAPPASEAQGGCRSCSTTGTRGSGTDLGLIALAALWVRRRPRRTSARRRSIVGAGRDA